MRERPKEELRNYLVVAAYLCVCFGALLLYRAALLSGSGPHTLSRGAAGKLLLGSTPRP